MEHAKTAKMMLREQREKYERRKPCKWFVMLLFMLFGSVLLMLITRLITFVSNSMYDRKAMEQLMTDLIGQRNISQAISDEIIITAYEYNSQQPRLFSKHLAQQEPNRYEMVTSLATGSSSAAPLYFEP